MIDHVHILAVVPFREFSISTTFRYSRYSFFIFISRLCYISEDLYYKWHKQVVVQVPRAKMRKGLGACCTLDQSLLSFEPYIVLKNLLCFENL